MRAARFDLQAARWSALLAVATAACGVDVVEVNVALGECQEDVISAATSVDVVLKRDDNARWVGGCAKAVERLGSVDALGDLLQRSFTFREVPVGGRWTLAVKGFSDPSCRNAPETPATFCGWTTNIILPPPRGNIEVSINCPPLGGVEFDDYKKCLEL